jgi:hypothetical protein
MKGQFYKLLAPFVAVNKVPKRLILPSRKKSYEYGRR